MLSASQVLEGIKESTGLDIKDLIASRQAVMPATTEPQVNPAK